MKLSSLSMMTTLFLSASAIANVTVEKTGLWLGAGLGSGYLNESAVVGDANAKSVALSSKVELGYDFNEDFGLYSSYDFVQNRFGEDNLHIGSFGIKGKKSMTNTIDLFSKLGAAYPFGERNRNGFIGVIGVGLELQLTHAVSSKVGIDFYDDLELRQGHKADLAQVYWGMSYRFGQPITPLVITKAVEVIKEVPVEVIKEVPVEVIKEVPVEVIKEVPVEVTKEVRKEKVVISSATGNELFKSNSSLLEQTGSLESLLGILKKSPMTNVTIIGYTDSRGSERYNKWMSERRAKSVANYFKDNGIDKSRITALGKGESSPVATNKTAFGRSKNRRVEIIIE